MPGHKEGGRRPKPRPSDHQWMTALTNALVAELVKAKERLNFRE